MCIRDRSLGSTVNTIVCYQKVNAPWVIFVFSEVVDLAIIQQPLLVRKQLLRSNFPGFRSGFHVLCVCLPYSALIPCLLYTSDAADEEDSVDLGGRRIIKKKKKGKERCDV
eukprot:TRINITY_DN1533_c0_g1_i6.p1 TRINITY_DN1533_c0_g1~~TRINITY_DN1533_c0_g1_i6.p1  ORF type:complete len:111 (+),score=15.05 TRINITY_DN1533_c0_g1_i6:197-529(+)